MVNTTYQLQNSQELELSIRNNNPNLPSWDMQLLHQILGNISGEQLSEFISPLYESAVNYAHVVEDTVRRFEDLKTVTLERWVVKTVLANAFLCKVPDEHLAKGSGINFNSLYSSVGRSPPNKYQKLMCLVSYLETAFSPKGTVIDKYTLEYKKNAVFSFPSPQDRKKELLRRIDVVPDQSLSDAIDVPQVDFANKRVGGGVLSNGCLQEEIKFITHPELLLTKLFPGAMRDNEAIIVTGALLYVSHSGYGDNFTYHGPADPQSSSGLPVIAIDALDFSKRNPLDQFTKENIDREWKKAFAGFSGVGPSYDTIATGNWGGGNFKGDSMLKMKIQWLAASLANKNLRYYPYRDKHLGNAIQSFARDWENKTIGDLYEHLMPRRNPPPRHLAPNKSVVTQQPIPSASKRAASPIPDVPRKRKRLEDYKAVEPHLLTRPKMHSEVEAHSLTVTVTEAINCAALSFDEAVDSNSCYSENEEVNSKSVSYFEMAAVLVIGGVCAIFQNWF